MKTYIRQCVARLLLLLRLLPGPRDTTQTQTTCGHLSGPDYTLSGLDDAIQAILPINPPQVYPELHDSVATHGTRGTHGTDGQTGGKKRRLGNYKPCRMKTNQWAKTKKKKKNY